MSDSGISSVFVAGAGLMGSGIAQTAAQSGLTVVLYDALEGAAARAIAQIGARLERAEQSGRLAAGAAAAAREHLRGAEGPRAAADSQMVIEAISEKLETKLAFWSAMDEICPESVLFASNTSSIPITRLAAATGRPAQFMGMHFYSPVPVMELVELVRGVLTSDATYATVERLSRELGKLPVGSADTPGLPTVAGLVGQSRPLWEHPWPVVGPGSPNLCSQGTEAA